MKYLKTFKRLLSGKWFYIILLAFLSYAPFIIFSKCENCLLGTTGDFVSIYNIKEFFSNSFSSFDTSYYGGAGRSFRIPQFLPYYLMIWILGLFHMGPSQADAFFLLSTIFFNSLSVFLYLRYALAIQNGSTNDDTTNNFFAFIGSLLFTLAPFFTNFIRAGHFLLFPMFGSFALLLYFFEKAQSLAGNRTENRKIHVKLFLLFFIIPLPFSNIGYIGSYFLCFGVYVFSYALILRKSFVNILKSYIKILLLFMLSNAWWLIPLSLTLGNIAYHEELSRNTLGQYIGVATEYSNPANILLGQSEGPLSLDKLFKDGPSQAISYSGYLLLFIFSIYTIVIRSKQKNAKIYILFVSILLITILIKGPKNPFPHFFNYLYDNVGLMQIFRRPSSKVYFFSLLMTTILSTYSVSFIYSRLRKIYRGALILFLLVLVANFYHVFVLRLGYLREFNIPSEYYEIQRYLEKDRVEKILILPDIGENPVRYDESLNNVSGVDFMNYFFSYPMLIPNHNLMINNEFYTQLSGIEHATNLEEFCRSTRKFSVTHILVKKNLLNKNYGLPYEQLTQKFLSYGILTPISQFGAYTDVYRVDDLCVEGIVKTSDYFDVNLLSKITRSLYVSQKFYQTNEHVSVVMNNRRDGNWKLYVFQAENCNISCIINSLRPIANESENIAQNKWRITTLSTYSPIYFVLVFFPDFLLYICFIFTIGVFFALLFGSIYSYINATKKGLQHV